jgi:hypothetical protein
MNATVDSDTQLSRTFRIPSLLTNSFRAVLEHYGGQIVRIQANGSVTTTNQTLVDELREYGVVREQETNHRLQIDYTQLGGDEDGEPDNPLNDEAMEAICEELTTLNTDEISVEPDLSVTSMTVRVTDDRLAEVTPAQTSEFDLQFVADPAEEAVREATRRRNSERGLYTDLGFNVKNLNLRSVVETATLYTEQSDGRYMSWQGPEDIRPKLSEQLVIRINQHILPEEYGTLKPYQVTDDQVLDIANDDFDDLDSERGER